MSNDNLPPPVPADAASVAETVPPPLPTEPPPTEAAFRPLDPRVVNLWRVSQVITSLVLLGLLLIPGVILSFNFRGAFKFVAIAWGAIAILFLVLLFWYPRRAYLAWGYRIDGKVLETRSGVWFRVMRLLPLSRLQHVDLHRGPIERSFGLASLALHTAGTVQSTIVIPGLEASEAARLRDQLVAIGGDDAV